MWPSIYSSRKQIDSIANESPHWVRPFQFEVATLFLTGASFPQKSSPRGRMKSLTSFMCQRRDSKKKWRSVAFGVELFRFWKQDKVQEFQRVQPSINPYKFYGSTTSPMVLDFIYFFWAIWITQKQSSPNVQRAFPRENDSVPRVFSYSASPVSCTLLCFSLRQRATCHFFRICQVSVLCTPSPFFARMYTLVTAEIFLRNSVWRQWLRLPGGEEEKSRV